MNPFGAEGAAKDRPGDNNRSVQRKEFPVWATTLALRLYALRATPR